MLANVIERPTTHHHLTFQLQFTPIPHIHHFTKKRKTPGFFPTFFSLHISPHFLHLHTLVYISPPCFSSTRDVDANAHDDSFKTAMERNSTCQNATDFGACPGRDVPCPGKAEVPCWESNCPRNLPTGRTHGPPPRTPKKT